MEQVKRIIATSFYEVNDDWREGFEEFCEINDLNIDEEDIDEYIQYTLSVYLDDEKCNLNKECGYIIAIADLGLWDGRHSAYQLIKTRNLNGIFQLLDGGYNDYEYYCDRYNVKADLYHHDGVNHVTFREVREGKNIQPLLDKIYNGEELTAEYINRYTKSLRPMVADVYGW
jgi:hypothetical protein